MGFVKLDCAILDSTIWFDLVSRNVFLTALLMAEPREFLEPVKQLHVDSLEETGWAAPAGWYGFVPASGPGILVRANVDRPAGIDALRLLGEPEHESRSPEYGGRRMIRCDGGYLLLNYQKYRDKDHGSAERMRRFRERKQKVAVTPSPSDVTVTPLRRNVTQAEAEAEAYLNQERETHRRSTDVPENGEEMLIALAKTHPAGQTLTPNAPLPYQLAQAIIEAIEEEAKTQNITRDDAVEYLKRRNLLYTQAVAQWPKADHRFIANHVRWYTTHQYRQDEAVWERAAPAPPPLVNRKVHAADAWMNRRQARKGQTP